MHPVNFEGAIEVKKPEDMTDEQCVSVWAKFGFDRLWKIIQSNGIANIPAGLYAGVDTEQFPYYLTAWKPNKEDIDAINKGLPSEKPRKDGPYPVTMEGDLSYCPRGHFTKKNGWSFPTYEPFTHYLREIESLPISREQAYPSVLENTLQSILDAPNPWNQLEYNLWILTAREEANRALAIYRSSKPSPSITREQAEAEASLHFNKEYNKDEWNACVSCFLAAAKILTTNKK